MEKRREKEDLWEHGDNRELWLLAFRETQRRLIGFCSRDSLVERASYQKHLDRNLIGRGTKCFRVTDLCSVSPSPSQTFATGVESPLSACF